MFKHAPTARCTSTLGRKHDVHVTYRENCQQLSPRQGTCLNVEPMKLHIAWTTRSSGKGRKIVRTFFSPGGLKTADSSWWGRVRRAEDPSHELAAPKKDVIFSYDSIFSKGERGETLKTEWKEEHNKGGPFWIRKSAKNTGSSIKVQYIFITQPERNAYEFNNRVQKCTKNYFQEHFLIDGRKKAKKL